MDGKRHQPLPRSRCLRSRPSSTPTPLTPDHGRTWNRLLLDSRYTYPDDVPGEMPLRGWTRTFPHVLTGAAGRPDEQFRAQWEVSPFSDAYLGRMAIALVEAFGLGTRTVTDVLGVSFSATDLTGHRFGPRSNEVQDVLAHLDVTIGALLENLDRLVGRDRYVVALTSDHGVSEIPGSPESPEGGRLNGPRLTEVAERVAQAVAGPGRYLARISTNDVYFEPGMYEKLAASPSAISSVVRALEDQPDVLRVFRREQLTDRAETAGDDLWRAAQLMHVPGQSGELLLVPAPGWLTAGTTAVASHGTPHAYNQHVPMLLAGPGIKPGTYSGATTPADMAPTLAALAGLALPQAQGRVLREADRRATRRATVSRRAQAHSPFTARVLAVVRRIPPGSVATYGEVAARAGRPRAARAVGNIMRACRQPDVPCHRVIAAGGALGGYSSSTALKRALLVAEGVPMAGSRVQTGREGLYNCARRRVMRQVVAGALAADLDALHG